MAAVSSNRLRLLCSSSRVIPQTGIAISIPKSSRGYATTDPSPSATNSSPTTLRRQTTFQDKLNAGPSFSDFVSGGNDNAPLDPSEAYELKTALVGPAGRKMDLSDIDTYRDTVGILSKI